MGSPEISTIVSKLGGVDMAKIGLTRKKLNQLFQLEKLPLSGKFGGVKRSITS